ncbi:hypothetical protein A2U01_0014858, partial [Trifolium medium]|nr:hypothetical protein [Trifolium medium]
CSGPSLELEHQRVSNTYTIRARPNGQIPLRIVTAVNRNDEHLLHIKASKPFSGSHLMAINAIKGLSPALGAIYMHLHFICKVHNPPPLQQGSQTLSTTANAGEVALF